MTDWYRSMWHHTPEESANRRASLTGWAVMDHHLDGQQGPGVQDLTLSGPLSLRFSGLKRVASASVFTEVPLPCPCPWPGDGSQALSLGLSSPRIPYALRLKTQEQTRSTGRVESLLLGRAPQAHPWSG